MEGPNSIKQRIIELIQRLQDDVDFDRAIEGIHLLRRIEVGLRESESNDGTEHEEFMQELLAEMEMIPT